MPKSTTPAPKPEIKPINPIRNGYGMFKVLLKAIDIYKAQKTPHRLGEGWITMRFRDYQKVFWITDKDRYTNAVAFEHYVISLGSQPFHFNVDGKNQKFRWFNDLAWEDTKKSEQDFQTFTLGDGTVMQYLPRRMSDLDKFVIHIKFEPALLPYLDSLKSSNTLLYQVLDKKWQENLIEQAQSLSAIDQRLLGIYAIVILEYLSDGVEDEQALMTLDDCKIIANTNRANTAMIKVIEVLEKLCFLPFEPPSNDTFFCRNWAFGYNANKQRTWVDLHPAIYHVLVLMKQRDLERLIAKDGSPPPKNNVA